MYFSNLKCVLFEIQYVHVHRIINIHLQNSVPYSYIQKDRKQILLVHNSYKEGK